MAYSGGALIYLFITYLFYFQELCVWAHFRKEKKGKREKAPGVSVSGLNTELLQRDAELLLALY